MGYETLYKDITTSTAPQKLMKILGDVEAVKRAPYHPSQRGNYCVRSHEGPFDRAGYEKARQSKPFRKEEWMCKMCKSKSFDPVGEIVDYQVPLKASRGEDDGMGKIDLLSKSGDTAYLLEVKVPDSTESPLRAIMEIYTYWRQLGGEAPARFLDRSKAKGATVLKKGIVIFEKEADSSEKYLYQKLKAQWRQYSELLAALDVECFVADLKEENPSCDEIVGLRLCAL